MKPPPEMRELKQERRKKGTMQGSAKLSSTEILRHYQTVKDITIYLQSKI